MSAHRACALALLALLASPLVPLASAALLAVGAGVLVILVYGEAETRRPGDLDRET